MHVEFMKQNLLSFVYDEHIKKYLIDLMPK